MTSALCCIFPAKKYIMEISLLSCGNVGGPWKNVEGFSQLSFVGAFY
jgi:hypothetical protein